MLIDLHIHTNYSDGTFTVGDILKEAEIRNITTISITDHNTIEAYNYINKINVKQLYTGDIILGTELNCVFKDFRIELLGYNFSNFDFLENWLKLNYSNEKEVVSAYKSGSPPKVITDSISYFFESSATTDTAAFLSMFIFLSFKTFPTEQCLQRLVQALVTENSIRLIFI